MWNRVSELWCRTFHARAMWPIHGKYICPTCLREYPVAWEDTPARLKSTAAAGHSINWSAKAHALLQQVSRLKRLGTM